VSERYLVETHISVWCDVVFGLRMA
jgi:hypothetical protein